MTRAALVGLASKSNMNILYLKFCFVQFRLVCFRDTYCQFVFEGTRTKGVFKTLWFFLKIFIPCSEHTHTLAHNYK